MKQKFKSVKEKMNKLFQKFAPVKEKAEVFLSKLPKGNHTVRNIIRELHFSIDIPLFSTLF